MEIEHEQTSKISRIYNKLSCTLFDHKYQLKHRIFTVPIKEVYLCEQCGKIRIEIIENNSLMDYCKTRRLLNNGLSKAYTLLFKTGADIVGFLRSLISMVFWLFILGLCAMFGLFFLSQIF